MSSGLISILVDGASIEKGAARFGAKIGMKRAVVDYENAIRSVISYVQNKFGAENSLNVEELPPQFYTTSQGKLSRFRERMERLGFEFHLRRLKSNKSCSECGHLDDAFSWRPTIAAEAVALATDERVSVVVVLTSSREFSGLSQIIPSSFDIPVVFAGFPGFVSPSLEPSFFLRESDLVDLESQKVETVKVVRRAQ